VQRPCGRENQKKGHSGRLLEDKIDEASGARLGGLYRAYSVGCALESLKASKV
jgi:hypothetical protein